MLAALLWCAAGLVALVFGAELLTRAGMRLAALAGIPPILIGLTIVALGTSVPELAIGIDAALQGNGSLAVGNIAGTNTVNICFILGLSALIAPLALEARTIRVDLPAMAAAGAAFVGMSLDGVLTRTEGAILVAAAFAYTGLLIHGARHASHAETAALVAAVPVPARVRRRPPVEAAIDLVLLAAGIAAVVVGADWLVEGAVGLARLLGVSDAFIGLTVVAIGTSSPELVTTIVSTLRGQRDIAVGNLIGSSVYNILAIMGLTLIASPGGIPVEAVLVRIDIPVMFVAVLACIPLFVTGRRLTRGEGGALVAAYLVYLGYLIVARG